MQIKFLTTAEVDLKDNPSDDFYSDTFLENEVVDVEILEDKADSVDAQLVDGSVAYGLPKCVFIFV